MEGAGQEARAGYFEPRDIGDVLVALGDGEFPNAWRRLSLDERSTLPLEVQRECVDRMRRLEPWVGQSIERAARGAAKADRANVENDAPLPFEVAPVSTWAARTPPPRAWTWRDWMPAGRVTR